MIVPSVERWRAPLETVFGTPRHPVRDRGAGALPDDAARACAALAAAVRLGGRRPRASSTPSCASPYSGVARTGVDFAEGRLRGRAVDEPGRVEEETERLREAPLVALRELRDAESPLEGVRGAARAR